ncbi:signal transduction histidine-protein kinase/phosphatase DegS [Sporosarcina sp. NCCP-2331]|nr:MULTISPECIES: sensor histidine kinase [Sporosarcina]GKV64906.1 signal transduction histidine-protein kinase/phosphatase DegS [Sporosarcina sp. NCCP-2331]GLB55016.1 signal transduction histidine-protein kinase/phosphatase DegS [Sporosarcina sp. NCCP-2378]
MNEKAIDIHQMEKIFGNMVHVMDQSKNDIFLISEQSRKSFEEMQRELAEVKDSISHVITEGDYLEDMSRHSRKRLANVSKNFTNYSEDEVKQAYSIANDLLVRVSINKMEEKQMRERRDELERRLALLLSTIERADQLVNQVTTVITYLTSDLKNVSAALETARHKQDFAIQIIQAQEEERKRLSRDIHDGPAQMLANVLMRSGLIEKTFVQKGPDNALRELSQLKESVRGALSEVRRIIYDLRPMALDDLGLVPTLKKYLSTISEYEAPLTIHFHSSGSERRFDSNFEVGIFRMIQESVNNCIKHAKTDEIWVKIEWMRDTVNILVKDQGCGFDTNEVKEKSFGLIGMQERVDLLKGEMTVNSNIGEGTSILFRIPLDE